MMASTRLPRSYRAAGGTAPRRDGPSEPDAPGAGSRPTVGSCEHRLRWSSQACEWRMYASCASLIAVCQGRIDTRLTSSPVAMACAALVAHVDVITEARRSVAAVSPWYFAFHGNSDSADFICALWASRTVSDASICVTRAFIS